MRPIRDHSGNPVFGIAIALIPCAVLFGILALVVWAL